MEIFVSYRRGGVDQPNAGRIYDYLTSLGYQCYYDRDETSNPTGAQFPQTIETSLRASKIIIAVIGESWIEQIDRLANAEDWVRKELLHASSQPAPHFIPIYIEAEPSQLGGKLPSDLAFIESTNSHYIWPGFEDQQKQALAAKLRDLLPHVTAKDKRSDSPRLELLCDRSREVDRFDHVLRKRLHAQYPGAWLVFGEINQGQDRLFARITDFTLRNSPYPERYPLRKEAINLDLHEFYGCSEEEMRSHVLGRAARDLSESDLRSYEHLYGVLLQKKISLTMFYSVVYVTSVKEAEWWIQRFTQMCSTLPEVKPAGPQVIFALSVAYREKKGRLLSLFKRPQEITRFFEAQYPEHFGADDVDARMPHIDTAIPTSRLRPAQEGDVRNWCDNREVRPHIDGIPKQAFLQPFEDAVELPMDHVIDHLAEVLSNHKASHPKGGNRA